MESEPGVMKKVPLKKSFSAPVKKPHANKSSKASEKEKNDANSSKNTENCMDFKEGEATKNLSNLTQSKKKSSCTFKQGKNKQPKSFHVIDYEELFRNVINASEINELVIEEPLKDKICTDKSSNINEKESVKAEGIGASINIIKVTIDETCEKPPLVNDINDMDSIASDEIDEWDNLSTVVKEENETTPINTVKCNKDIAVVKKKVEKQNKLPPKQLFTKPEKAKHSIDIQDKKTNLPMVINDSVLSRDPKKKKKIRKPNQSTLPVKNCNADLENSCISEEEETGTWVQCTNSMCNKWRYLQDIEDPQLVPDNWECKMNSDIEHNTCSLPEVQYDESEHIFTKYTLGSVVWAKMDGYPWWPALIDNDPDYETYFEIPSEECMVPTNFHVTFFGNCATRAWLKPACIVPYVKKEPKCKISVGHKKDINLAMKLAETALNMKLKERLENYGFVKNFRRKSKALKKSVCESEQLPALKKKKCRNSKDCKGITQPSNTCENGDSHKSSKTASLNDVSLEALSEINQPADENKVQRKHLFTPENKVDLKENVVAQPTFEEEEKEMKSEKIICDDHLATSSEQSKLLQQEHQDESEKEIKNSKIPKESRLKTEANEKIKCNVNKRGQHCKQNTTSAKEDIETKENETSNTSKTAIETTNSNETQSIIDPSDLQKQNINPVKNVDGSPVKRYNINKQKEIPDNKISSSKKEIKKTISTNSKKLTLKSTSCDSITNKAVEVENINIPTDETEQITLDRKHKSKTCHIESSNKKIKKNEESFEIDLQATEVKKSIRKKNIFSVPVPKIVLSLPENSISSVECAPSTPDDNLVNHYEDNDSHMVPDIKMSVVREDATNADEELELENDMTPVLLKGTDELENGLGNTKRLSLKFEQPDCQRVLSDDDSSDFMLDIETADDNEVVENFNEAHGRFGGRCFEHGSDSDPLDLIED